MDCLEIHPGLAIPLGEIELTATTAQGPGGQHVNRSCTAIQLRFNLQSPSLPDSVRNRLIQIAGSRLSGSNEIVIRAQSHRSQEMNRREALQRLQELIARAAKPKKSRRPTKPTGASRKRRLDSKARRGRTKTLRGKVRDDS